MVIYRKLASSSIAAIEKALRARLDRLANVPERTAAPDDVSIEDLINGGDDQDDLGDAATTPQFFDDEEGMLRTLIVAAQTARRSDEKLAVFLEKIVTPLVAQEKRLLVFTEYRATQDYLQLALQQRFPDCTVALINGSMNLAAKLDAIRAFRDSATFLISTEAGGEGINLQDSCHVMVNYDLPWNPARLVQRIGRLYRYGQKSKVIVFNLHAADSFDNQTLSLMLDRVMTVAREMAPVGPEFSESLYTEIVGELLENLDMATILQRATADKDRRTRAEIDEAISRARAAKRLQDELLSYATGFDPTALGGTLGLGMTDVRSFILSILPFIQVTIDATTHDGRVLELRLPEEMRGRFAEFQQRTVVRITTDRALAQRLNDVTLLDFESGFFLELIRYAQRPEFGGDYAIIKTNEFSTGIIVAYRLRWQNDQGEPIVDEFLIGQGDETLNVTLNPRSAGEWLRGPLVNGSSPELDPNRRYEIVNRIRAMVDRRLGEESSRFKHPNGLVLLGAASTVSARVAGT